MLTPDFVAVGHVVRDVQPDGWRVGGTVVYAAVQANHLGLRAAIVSRHSSDAEIRGQLPGIDVFSLPSDDTTTFQNAYDGSHRRQLVLQQAAPFSPSDVPESWRSARIILLGPVCGELKTTAQVLFPDSLLGVSAQGWLREVGDDNTVLRVPWDREPFWTAADVLFVSEEDLGDYGRQVDRWIRDVPIVVVTCAGQGARVHASGRWRSIQGFPAAEEDPTGAGDVFAAAFMVRYHESREVDEASRFASAAAARSIEGTGIEAISSRRPIEERMAKHPEIVLT